MLVSMHTGHNPYKQSCFMEYNQRHFTVYVALRLVQLPWHNLIRASYGPCFMYKLSQ